VDFDRVKKLLEGIQDGTVAIDEGIERLSALPVNDLGHTQLDTHRALRCGFPEVVYGEGKTTDELLEISRQILAQHDRLLITRVDADAAAVLCESLPGAHSHPRSRMVTVNLPAEGTGEGLVAVISAGTSDWPVAEEAEITARMLGARTAVRRDVGVAGIHRVLEHRDLLREARALVVVAGMEGALPSVVGGLVDRPVVAVPTSVGYGASLGGLTALLSMLNSCAAGVTVVNVDNGFGGGYAAALMNRTGRSDACTAPEMAHGEQSA